MVRGAANSNIRMVTVHESTGWLKINAHTRYLATVLNDCNLFRHIQTKIAMNNQPLTTRTPRNWQMLANFS